MQNSKLFILLKTFTKKELQRFDDFLASPYYNKHNDTLRWWKILRKYAPGFAHKNLEKTIVFAKLFPNTPFNPQWLYDLNAYLLRLAEQFLATENYLENQPAQKRHLLSALAIKRLDTFWDNHHVLAQQQLASNQTDNTDYWLDHYSLSKLYQYHYDDYSRRHAMRHFKEANTRKVFDALSILYVMDGLMHQSYEVNNHLSHNFSFDDSFLTRIYPLAVQNLPPGNAFIANALHQAILLSYTNTAHYFTSLLATLHQTEFAQISPRIQRSLLTNMTNYCLKNLPTDENLYRSHLFGIYQSLIQLGLLVVNGSFLVVPFCNIVQNALQVGENAWAKYFIDTYSQELDLSVRQNAISFCEANICFYDGQFSNALVLLHQTDPKFRKSMASLKNLLIRIYYELGETDALLSQIDALKHYLSDAGNLTPLLKAANQSFANFVLQLLRLQENPDEAKAQRLKHSIQQSPLIYKEWLLQKVDDITYSL